MLDTIANNYKPKGSGLYTELMRQLLSITIKPEGGVRQYEKDFRKVNAEIADLDSRSVLPESFLIQLFLMGLGDSFEVFMTTYTQTHTLFGDNAVRFDEVTYAAVNEERRILSSNNTNIAMLTHRNKGKDKQPAKKNSGNDNNRETCPPYKAAGKKFRHPPAKCWTKFPHLKPEKFMTAEEKKKKTAIDAINFNSNGEGPSNKRKRVEEAPSNVSAPGENDYLNANYAFIEELDSSIHLSDAALDDYNILGAADQDEQVINLMALMAIDSKLIDSKLDRNLIAADSLNLCARVIVDSSCSRHSFADRSVFITYENTHSRPIKDIGGSQVQFLGCGTISLNCSVQGRCVIISLPNILHVPDMGINLLSVGKLFDADIKVAFHKTGCTLTKDDLELTGTRNRDLFFLDLWQSRNNALAAYSVPSDPIHQL